MDAERMRVERMRAAVLIASGDAEDFGAAVCQRILAQHGIASRLEDGCVLALSRYTLDGGAGSDWEHVELATVWAWLGY